MTRKNRYSAIFNFSVCFLMFCLCQKLIKAQDLLCCSHATGSCRSACEKISLVELAASRELRNQTILEVQKYCSPQLNSFWECLNATFKDMSKGDSWSGRVCCPIPHSESCRRACITSSSIYDLLQGCRQSDEIAFFACLDRQRDGDVCCSNAKDDDCKEACMDVFRSQLTPTKQQRDNLKSSCENTSPKISDCVKDFVRVTPVNSFKHLHCCDMSNEMKCREGCKKVLSTKTTMQEILDGLQLEGCGPPLPQKYFWQCFLKITEGDATSAEVSKIDRVGMDSAKWHCCQRATTPTCQRLCSETFTKFWSTFWEEFHLKCLSQVSEENLRKCIDEVDEPCELGCDGLSFCTNFNNRPTELFRSCTAQADEAARNDVTLWQSQNELTLPGLVLPLKNISKCSPNIWKAAACTLQIKPCSRHSHANQICRSFCLEILTQCVDWARVNDDHTADSVCATLSPRNPNDACISLEKFLTPSENDYRRVAGQVYSPCKGDPCEADEVCVVNKNCHYGQNCLPYTCVPGCKMGEVSEYMVPHGTYVRIPIPKKPKGCLKICRCNMGRIEECQPLPCISLTSCLLGNTQQLHGSNFKIDCNSCSCYAGEVICGKKQCESNVFSGRNTAYTTLPCNCPPHFMPVCGTNGISYPSACLAKCALLADSNIDHGPCQDPCKNHQCPIGHRCVPSPQVCLSLMHKPCKQYICVNGASNCKTLPKELVCDKENRQHDNPCFLAHENAKFAYKGPCLQNCKHKGQVCGINGRTYYSECAAWADMVSVDYEGPCIAVGLITNTKSPRCSNVKCMDLPDKNCLGVTPPGACCPLCGGSLKLLYSRKQVDRVLYARQNRFTEPLTLEALLKALDRQIQVAQCVLRGYITVELEIFVTVQSTERHPDKLQLEACVREAEKIANLINMQSSRIASELSLSSLTSAEIVHTLDTSRGARVEFACVLVMMGLIVTLVR